jgi:hypothetical protein
MAGDKQLAKKGALLCQRCLLCSGLAIFRAPRSGYEFDPKLAPIAMSCTFAEGTGCNSPRSRIP